MFPRRHLCVKAPSPFTPRRREHFDLIKIRGVRQQKPDGDDRKQRAQVGSRRGSVIIHEAAVSAPWATAKQTHTHTKKTNPILHILHSEERI